MSIPLRQTLRLGAYIARRHFGKERRYPLVLMLEPLFRCNLSCAGCGKIDYPDTVLNARLSVEDCIGAALECGAPIVSVAGGEPLLHHDIDKIVSGLIAHKKFVYLCSNGLLMEKRLHLFKPSPYFTWQIHLDGGREEHDRAVSLPGTFDRAISAIKAAKAKGFRVNINCTLFSGTVPEKMAHFLDEIHAFGIDGVTISPGYAYERAPDTGHFLNRRNTRQLFRELFRLGRGHGWRFSQSSLFLDFLAGNQPYHCTPWGNPTRNVFGWQRPCYLLSEGYAPTYKALIEETDWESYGTGNYEKCADCMVHCGYEPTAVTDTMSHPLKALKVALFGPRLDGPMAPDMPLSGQRPAQDVYDEVVAEGLKLLETQAGAKDAPRRAKSA